MTDKFPFKKPIRMIKLQDQVENLFNGTFKKSQDGKGYVGTAEGRDVRITCIPGKPFLLQAKSEEEWEIAHKAITQYLTYFPQKSKYPYYD